MPVRTSITHSSEFIDFPKTLTDKNVVKNECSFKKVSVMKTNILISVPSNIYISLEIKP